MMKKKITRKYLGSCFWRYYISMARRISWAIPGPVQVTPLSTTICHPCPCYCEQQWRLDWLWGLLLATTLVPLTAVKLVKYHGSIFSVLLVISLLFIFT
ncbi:hypothetical protein Godav_018333 [Gossypium davidsonii]|uniref:Uncharacterized protein n=2 Tax=Gossypium TaxID=3633 RepID=A0A7J8QWC7_GOSDV|nr:hypothetical protein [Gossypium davidsonii]MBA0640746.1 hypothetical protein [Gossypium klotzschianum]